ncbi:ankyrin [Anaplasma centrale str. Israel]|uniref:Ankyrin n=1 Tax=Anaplasma centrale (strain Israel) TaxID=574556 RepID=D1AUH7_ANACI|nr:ankyrin repeat domain-containing protein [Anaplasma centrale]ACZ49205.1 ankyrin [Anaplasma centrale str. Israel]
MSLENPSVPDSHDENDEKASGQGTAAPAAHIEETSEKEVVEPYAPPLPPREVARYALVDALGSMRRDDYADFVKNLDRVPKGHENAWLYESDLKTLLHYACSTGDPKYASYLLGQGCSMAAIDIQANTPLHDAAAAPDEQSAARLRLVLEHLGKGNPVENAINLKGEAPIHSAVACDNLENVKTFVRFGDYGLQDLESRSFLHRAARNQGDDFTSRILEHMQEQVSASPEMAKSYGALLCSEDLSGYLPVHYAATRGLENAGIIMLKETVAAAKLLKDEEGIKEILKHMGGTGNTIMNCAVKGRCVSLLEQVVEVYAQHYKAGFSIQDDEQRAPIHGAASYVSAALFALMLKNTHVRAYNKPTADGTNLLNAVMQDTVDRSRRQQKIKLCLDVPDIASWINTPGPNGRVPLCEMYLEQGGVEYVRDLLESSDRVDVDSRCTDGRSVIHLAAERGDAKVLAMLLSSRQKTKGNAKFPASKGQVTPAVHVLNTRGDDAVTLEVIKQLVPHEPSLEDVALCAARSGNYRVLRYVTDLSPEHGGIDINHAFVNAKGNAVSLCGELLRNGHIRIVEKLVKAKGARLEGVDHQCALSSAIQGKCFAGSGGNIAGDVSLERLWESIKIFFAEAADTIIAIFSKGMAVNRGIKSLMADGAEIRGYEVDATARGDDDIPLIFALKGVERPDPTLVRFLIRNGADVNCRDSAGDTALHVAVGLLKFPDKVECAQEFVNLLCARGASTRQRNTQGYTPLHLAAAYKNLAAFDSILKSNKLSALDRSVIDGSSAMHVAMKSGVSEAEIVRMLESCKTMLAPNELSQMLSTYDSSGNTLMHVAASLDFKNVVEFGLKNGAQMSIVNASGKLAHNLAPPNGRIAAKTLPIGDSIAHKMSARVTAEGGERRYTTVKMDSEFSATHTNRRSRSTGVAPHQRASSVAGSTPVPATNSANDPNSRGHGANDPGGAGGALYPDLDTGMGPSAGAQGPSAQRPSAPPMFTTPGDVVAGGPDGDAAHLQGPVPLSSYARRVLTGGGRRGSGGSPPPYSEAIANDDVPTTPTNVSQDPEERGIAAGPDVADQGITSSAADQSEGKGMASAAQDVEADSQDITEQLDTALHTTSTSVSQDPEGRGIAAGPDVADQGITSSDVDQDVEAESQDITEQQDTALRATPTSVSQDPEELGIAAGPDVADPAVDRGGSQDAATAQGSTRSSIATLSRMEEALELAMDSTGIDIPSSAGKAAQLVGAFAAALRSKGITERDIASQQGITSSAADQSEGKGMASAAQDVEADSQDITEQLDTALHTTSTSVSQDAAAAQRLSGKSTSTASSPGTARGTPAGQAASQSDVDKETVSKALSKLSSAARAKLHQNEKSSNSKSSAMDGALDEAVEEAAQDLADAMTPDGGKSSSTTYKQSAAHSKPPQPTKYLPRGW